jgi:1-acyl-sn-glycerol-3-phosphate acyltransferase
VIRALLALPTFIAATLVGSLIALVFWVVDKTGDLVLALARLWSRVVLGVPGVKLEVVTEAPLDPRRPYVFMANHASMVDIWAMFVAVPVSFRFIAKSQLAGIPLFGWAMRAGRFIFIDRQNAASARRSIEEAARRIKGGQSVVIYPEGTRTRDGRVAPFKKGGFHLAMNSGAEIVPVAIIGSRAVMPRGAALIRAGTVKVEFGAPISTAGVTNGERNALVDRVRDTIIAMLGDPPDPAGSATARAEAGDA